MSDHDPLCPLHEVDYEADYYCFCEALRERDAQVRANERERMARLARVVQGGGIPDVLAEAIAAERERLGKVLTEVWGAAKASWRASGDSYWEGRMDALDYAIRIVEGEQP